MGGEMISAYLAARANSVAIVERLEYVCVGERERESQLPHTQFLSVSSVELLYNGHSD
jgi:hypothetical protein